MDNPGLPDALWANLDGRLWHATSREGLRGIVADKAITVGFSDRYLGSFARNQGSVSLFDFGPTSKDYPNQFNNWIGWLGRQQNTKVAVWLEIDRERVNQSLLDAKATREAVNALIARRHDLAPVIPPFLSRVCSGFALCGL